MTDNEPSHSPTPYIDMEPTPFTSPFGVLAPRITGSISAISSSLIIYLIFRSRQKMSTIYHRMMFFMSCGDVICSVAMALGTLPMPKTLPPEFENIRYFETTGLRLGNIATCEAQGFLWYSGTLMVFAYNVTLSMYYALSLAFMLKERTIRKYAEPLFHLFPIILILSMNVPLLIGDHFNPTDWEGWCTVMRICTNDKKCYRGSLQQAELTSTVLMILIFSFFFLMITSLLMVFLKVYRTERNLAEGARQYAAVFQHHAQAQAALNRLKDKHKTTKVIAVQATAYILSLFLTLLFPLLAVMGNIDLLGPKNGSYSNSQTAVVVESLRLVFTPLQGFFNFCIFLGHKIYNYRRVHGDKVKRTAVIKMLFCSSMDEPVMISRFSIVQDTAQAGEDANRRGLRVQVEDEMDDEVSYFIVRRMGEYVEIEEGDSSGSRLSLSTNSVIVSRMELPVDDENASVDGLSGIELKSGKYLTTIPTRRKNDVSSAVLPHEGRHKYADEDIEDPQRDIGSSIGILSYPSIQAQDQSGGNDVLMNNSSRVVSSSDNNLSGFSGGGAPSKKSSRGYMFFRKKKDASNERSSAKNISSLEDPSFARKDDHHDESLLSYPSRQFGVEDGTGFATGFKEMTGQQSIGLDLCSQQQATSRYGGISKQTSFDDSKDLSGFDLSAQQQATSRKDSRSKRASFIDSKDLSGFDLSSQQQSTSRKDTRSKQTSFVDCKDLSGFDLSSQQQSTSRKDSRSKKQTSFVDSKDLSGFDLSSQQQASMSGYGGRRKLISLEDESRNLSGFDLSSQQRDTSEYGNRSKLISFEDENRNLSGFDLSDQQQATSGYGGRSKLISFEDESRNLSGFDLSDQQQVRNRKDRRSKQTSFVDSKDLSGFDLSDQQQATSGYGGRSKLISLEDESRNLSGFDVSDQQNTLSGYGGRSKQTSFVDSKDLTGFDLSNQQQAVCRKDSSEDDNNDSSGFISLLGSTTMSWVGLSPGKQL